VLYPDDPVTCCNTACIYSMAGDQQTAMRYLAAYVRQSSEDMTGLIRHDSMLDCIRSEGGHRNDLASLIFSWILLGASPEPSSTQKKQVVRLPLCHPSDNSLRQQTAMSHRRYSEALLHLMAARTDQRHDHRDPDASCHHRRPVLTSCRMTKRRPDARKDEPGKMDIHLLVAAHRARPPPSCAHDRCGR